MKNKYYILIYVAAILGGVLGAYLLARNSIWGLIFAAFCAMFIIERSVNSWDTAMAKREQKKAAAKKEKEHKYNIAKNELFARNGKPCKTIVISESCLDQFNYR